MEDIAADFGVTPLVVKRRLTLAKVSPRPLADCQAGAVSIEQLMALSFADDHASQETAFYEAPPWQTLEELAEQASLHANYIRSLERGEHNVSLFNIWRIAAGLGLTPLDLLSDLPGDARSRKS